MSKTAVVVVHGMGQQEPGALQRSLGRALAGEDPMYVAPDRISGRTDTQRITITHPDGDETHVYEHYWSDRFQDTRLRHVLPWTLRLLRHRRLGRRIGGRNGALEWAVSIAALLPYLLLTMSIFLGGRSDAAVLLADVPVVSLLASIMLVAFLATKTMVRSHPVALMVGVAAGIGAAVLADPVPGLPLAASALALGWAPGWLLVAAGLRGFGPISVARLLVALSVAVPASLSLVEGRLLLGGLPAALTLAAAGFWFRHWIGDVARYLDHSAANAEEADRLRRDAADFLWNVATDTRYGYDRIVLVAHSQGGFVAYDALSRAWERWAVDHEVDFAERSAVSDIDRIAGDADPSPVEWGAAVGELHEALAGGAQPWRIAHFVTLGSPVGHAAGLLADGPADLDRKLQDRALASCPPRLHGEEPSIAYQSGRDHRFHHTSVFAATKWTNIVYQNDLLGGPVDSDGLGGLVRNEVLGEDDMSLSDTVLDFATRFPHDAYWKAPRPIFEPHVERTLDLLRHICHED